MVIDWNMKMRTQCWGPSSVIRQGPYASLKEAQHECMSHERCNKVMGTEGNEFDHTSFVLCDIDSKYTSLARENFFTSLLPDSVYEKPGKFLSCVY